MHPGLRFVSSLGAGAGLMLLLDPGRGARRRALVRDTFVHAMRKTRDAAGATSRDLGHRASGLAATLRRVGRRDEASDDVLVERVRAKLGRYVSHPRAIVASANEGTVTLSGPILTHEHRRLLRAVRSVRGVTHVDDRLEAHKERGNVPGLQGGAAPIGESWEFQERRWTPAMRLCSGLSGAALVAYGAARRDAVGAGLAILGLGLAVRGLTNLETSRLVGAGAGRRAVDVQKTIDIAAPVERVFAFWREFENFPHFMSHVKEVRATAVDGQSHWVVEGPGGAPLEFDAVVTELIPNEVIAWKTVEGAVVGHAGIVRFERMADDRTRLQIRMSYNPPAGAAGHAAAALLGADLKTLLDDDLLRMKTFIQTGRPPHDAAQQIH